MTVFLLTIGISVTCIAGMAVGGIFALVATVLFTGKVGSWFEWLGTMTPARRPSWRKSD